MYDPTALPRWRRERQCDVDADAASVGAVALEQRDRGAEPARAVDSASDVTKGAGPGTRTTNRPRVDVCSEPGGRRRPTHGCSPAGVVASVTGIPHEGRIVIRASSAFDTPRQTAGPPPLVSSDRGYADHGPARVSVAATTIKTPVTSATVRSFTCGPRRRRTVV